MERQASSAASEQPDAVNETLERLEVADTLEELRHHIDELIDQLSEKEHAAAAGGEEISPELEGQIEDLGDKVESASNLLAELTDLLEAQTERIETIEEQLGDPDLADFRIGDHRARIEAAEAAIPRFSMRPPAQGAVVARPEPVEDRSDLAIALHEYVDIRLERLEGGIRQIEQRITEIRGAAEERDRQVRELEERLLILVDAGIAAERGAAGEEPERAGGGDVRRYEQPGRQSKWRAEHSTARPHADFPLIPAPEPRPAHMPLFAHCSAGPSALGFVGRGASPGGSSPAFVHRTYSREANGIVRHGPPLAALSPFSIPATSTGATQTLLPLRVMMPAGAQDMDGFPPPVPLRVTEILAGWGQNPRPGKEQPEPMRELEKLVERDIRLQRDFSTPDDALRPMRAHPTVLVVDDSPDALKLVSIYLSKTGYQVVTASSAEDCLAKLRHHHIDALVLDAKMPGANGGHVCRVLQEDPAYAARRHIPVIVYTAYPDEYPSEIRARWRADEYVVKGGDMLPLITALVRHTSPHARS